jgi:hypothetical protein
MADKKGRSEPGKAARRSRASTGFTLGERFDDALRKAAVDQIARVREERDRQVKIDDLVVSAIRAANEAAGDTKLTVVELATAVNMILAQLVDEGVVAGVLPPSERVRGLVKKVVAETRTMGTDLSPH